MRPAQLEPHEISEAIDLVHHVAIATPGLQLTARFRRVHGAAVQARAIQRARVLQIRRLTALWRDAMRKIYR